MRGLIVPAFRFTKRRRSDTADRFANYTQKYVADKNYI